MDQDQIRIETVCTNQFRNDYIDGNEKQKVKINSFLSKNLQMKSAEAMGNSPCN